MNTFTFENGFKAMNYICDCLEELGVTGYDVNNMGAEIFFHVMEILNLEPDNNHLKDITTMAEKLNMTGLLQMVNDLREVQKR